MQESLKRIVRESLALDKISCSAEGTLLRPGKTVPSLHETILEFALVRPSDELLLRDQNYLKSRQAVVLFNLKNEIDRIASIKPEMIENLQIDPNTNVPPEVINKLKAERKKNFTTGQGKQMLQHYKQVFNEQPDTRKMFQQRPETLLEAFIFAQRLWLEDQFKSTSVLVFGR